MHGGTGEEWLRHTLEEYDLDDGTIDAIVRGCADPKPSTLLDLLHWKDSTRFYDDLIADETDDKLETELQHLVNDLIEFLHDPEDDDEDASDSDSDQSAQDSNSDEDEVDYEASEEDIATERSDDDDDSDDAPAAEDASDDAKLDDEGEPDDETLDDQIAQLEATKARLLRKRKLAKISRLKAEIAALDGETALEKKPCKFFPKGNCYKGNNCPFAH